MDLIERYLGAVRWNLPAGAKADDILAELREVIESRIEDREEQLGRPLTRDDISTLLKEFGHPLTIAGGYRDQRALIGADVFPFYWFALRVVLVIVAVIEAIELGGRVIVSSAPLAQTLAQAIHSATSSLLLNAAIVTLAFAIIERSGWLTDYLQRWKPESLPTLPSIAARPRKIGEPVMSIVLGIGFLAWWTGALPFNWMPHDSDVIVRAAPIWTALYWPLIALAMLGIVRDMASLLTPGWKLLRAVLMIGCAAGTVALAAMVYKAGPLVSLSSATANAERVAHMQHGLDTALAIAVPILAAVTILQCAVELWKLYREPR
ncbi:MAG: hypothetical protein EOP60_11845 [Sphingomonadales bacterium]|nr:MAG: hypothetical protein EOP60_11845 [Sphingomonadales bacterium]